MNKIYKKLFAPNQAHVVQTIHQLFVPISCQINIILKVIKTLSDTNWFGHIGHKLTEYC
jgi:hypothetical protein